MFARQKHCTLITHLYSDSPIKAVTIGVRNWVSCDYIADSFRDGKKTTGKEITSRYIARAWKKWVEQLD